MTFEELIAPMTSDSFLQHYNEKHFVHGKGFAGRYSHLLPWDTFSTILDQHRLDYPRLRLVRKGETLPPAAYIDYLTDRRGARVPRVNATGLSRELANGAMMHFAGADEVSGPLRNLADSLSTVFQSEITVNVCAGISNSFGFATHWDGHDVLVLQVHGKKKWRVFGTTIPSPIRRGKGMDSIPETERPTTPVWEGVLEDGDFLYLPRGCWHAAEGTLGETLHLTIGLCAATGFDFLVWLVDRLKEEDAIVRQDIPLLSGPTALRAHITKLSDCIRSALSSSAPEEYLRMCEMNRRARPLVNLTDHKKGE